MGELPTYAPPPIFWPDKEDIVFTWDGVGGNLLQQYDGTTKTSFLYGPGGLPVEQIAGSTTTYLHHDQLGSIRLITDSAGATGTASTQTWDPYGNSVSTYGSLASQFGFSGQYTDSESGLIYLRARYYDPTTAQFLTLDPMVATTMSPYEYVGGNPINGGDATGLDSAVPPWWTSGTSVCTHYVSGSGWVDTTIPLYKGDQPDSACARDFGSHAPGQNGMILPTSGPDFPETGSEGMDTGGAIYPADVNGGHNYADTLQNHPSELENKITVSCYSAAGDVFVTVTVGGPAAAVVTVIDVTHLVWEWTH